MVIGQAMPEIPWGDLSVGVALIVAVVIITGIVAVTVWKFLPKCIDAWQSLCKAIDAIADAVNKHIEKMEDGEEHHRRVHDEHSQTLTRIESGMNRVHTRLDGWNGGKQ